MASRTALLITAAMAVVVVGTLLPATASAKDYRPPARYKVGDDSGWKLGVNYSAWASTKDFWCGDQIEFVYQKGSHNVLKVDKASYDACTVPSGAVKLDSGDDFVTFGCDEDYQFFICGIEGHCQSGQSGMKLALNIYRGPF